MGYIVPKISITADERGCSDLEAATFSFPALASARGQGLSVRMSLATGGLRTKGAGMTTTYPVTITTLEELRLLKQEKQAGMRFKCDSMAEVFDEFDDIRAHGLGVTLKEGS